MKLPSVEAAEEKYSLWIGSAGFFLGLFFGFFSLNCPLLSWLGACVKKTENLTFAASF